MRKFLAKKSAENQKSLLTVVFIITVLLGFGLVYSASNKSSNRYSKARNCHATCVQLVTDKALPDTVAVKVGDYVQFNSADGQNHDMSLGKGGQDHDHHGKFESGEFKADEAWRVQFNEEGSFYFHDHLNPKINILVVVYTPGKEYKVQ